MEGKKEADGEFGRGSWIILGNLYKCKNESMMEASGAEGSGLGGCLLECWCMGAWFGSGP